MTTSVNRQEALYQFKLALKAGQKCYRDCVRRGRTPYPQILEGASGSRSARRI